VPVRTTTRHRDIGVRPVDSNSAHQVFSIKITTLL